MILDSNLTPTSSKENLKANRPEPIISEIEVIAFDYTTDPQETIDALLEGYNILIVDYFSSGLTLLNALKHYLKKGYSDASFQGQRDFRFKFQKLSNQILLEISDNKLAVRKAPEIGWIKKLYPEISDFLLPFTQVQGLNSSWQWYKKGIFIPVLKRKIHPWFGTYFPTRFEHLELFDSWIRRYKGEKKSAFDIGVGSGILSFQLLKQGFDKIYATDFNPNAIIGLKENGDAINSKIQLLHGDLFVNSTEKSELIVFNPPWLPAIQSLNQIDKAIYYSPDLFHRFFAEAEKHLQTNGKIVLLFSNLAQITKVDDSHPIEKELSEGDRFEKELFLQKQVRSASKNTKRNPSWRSEEKVELWVLKLKTQK